MKTILIIDDDTELLTSLSSALEAAGYKVESANSAHSGLAKAYEQVPDLILCDIRMPDLEGTSVLQALRVDPATAKSPIVLMTGVLANVFTREKALEIGADDFLRKPFTMQALLDCIRARLPGTAA